jgi:hypothetical protein
MRKERCYPLKHRDVHFAGSVIGDCCLLYCRACGHFLEGYTEDWLPSILKRKREAKIIVQ